MGYSPRSLARGLFYYFVSLLAALYVFTSTLSRDVRRTVRRVWRSTGAQIISTGGAEGKKDGRRDSVTEAKKLSVIDQLPRYRHASDGISPLSSSAHDVPSVPWSLSSCPISHRSLIAPDGTRVSYSVLFPGNPKTMIFCSGLGFRSSFTAFAPIVHRYGRSDGDWTFITFEYRGLFSSHTSIARPRRLAIPNHAEDLFAILKREGRTADVLLGYSMGVQVSLEFVSLYPESVGKMILLNGTYGSVFESGFQPFFRVPIIPSLVNGFIEFLLDRPAILKLALKGVRPILWLSIRLYRHFLQNELLEQLLGSDYFDQFLNTYVLDIFTTEQHTANYLRLFQELNSHSTYHLLRHIEQPTLIVSGLLDPLTPAYLSFEMKRRIKNSRHVVAYLGSHCVLLERPQLLMREMATFLETDEATNAWASDHARKSLTSSASASSGHEDAHENRSFQSAFRHAGRVSANVNGINGSNALLKTPSHPVTIYHPEHSVARTTSAYYPHDSDSDGEGGLPDYRDRQLVTGMADGEAEDGGLGAEREYEAEERAAREEYSVQRLIGDAAEQFAEGFGEVPQQQPAKSATKKSEMKPSSAQATPARKDDTVAASASTLEPDTSHHHVALASATIFPLDNSHRTTALPSSHPSGFDPVLFTPQVAAGGGRDQKKVCILTCGDQAHRKGDDLSLLRHLTSSSIPCEVVPWNTIPLSVFSQGRYAAVVCRSPWGYFKQQKEWTNMLEQITKARVPCMNSTAILGWNAHKQYLQEMIQKRESSSSSSSSDAEDSGFDFIPTIFLHQSDLVPMRVEEMCISRGWTVDGAVLKPTSSAGGFQTIRLPSPGNLAFATQIHLAARAELKGPEGKPTWMLQPFQPSIVHDGEYSFLFLTLPKKGAADPNEVELTFIHAANKKPRSGSFLVQPTQGGVLTPHPATPGEIRAAKAMLRATPFKLEEFTYVRVDCIRAVDKEGQLTERLLLMEIEACEPDMYSHLTPSFGELYFDCVKSFLQRNAAWLPKEENSDAPVKAVVSSSSSSGAAAPSGRRVSHVAKLIDDFETKAAAAPTAAADAGEGEEGGEAKTTGKSKRKKKTKATAAPSSDQAQ